MISPDSFPSSTLQCWEEVCGATVLLAWLSQFWILLQSQVFLEIILKPQNLIEFLG